jgi:hypothetical protein
MFRLYNEERRIFSFEDYGALLTECRRLKVRTSLEFGPGISTLALVEAGAAVVTCEYSERWLNGARELLKGYSEVRVLRYFNEPEARVEGLAAAETFDMAFVDSPLGLPSRGAVRHAAQEECNRLNTVLFAIERAPVVLLHDARRPGEQETLKAVIAAGHSVSRIETRKGIARIERRGV